MTQPLERRIYKRSRNTLGKALISFDGKKWDDVSIYDISAGGLKFISSVPFELNSSIYINIHLCDMLAEFDFPVQGTIIRIEERKYRSMFCVKFESMSKQQTVQMDELIRSKHIFSDTPPPFHDSLDNENEY